MPYRLDFGDVLMGLGPLTANELENGLVAAGGYQMAASADGDAHDSNNRRWVLKGRVFTAWTLDANANLQEDTIRSILATAKSVGIDAANAKELLTELNKLRVG